jgi:hypothetical protein
MPRSRESYVIRVHYPETSEGILNLKKKIGSAYDSFVKSYILSLPISGQDKNRLYTDVNDRIERI